MTLIDALKLGFKVRFTNIKASKINNSTFEKFEIILATFRVEDKFNRPRFFQKSFLLLDTSIKVVLRMFFLTFSKANI